MASADQACQGFRENPHVDGHSAPNTVVGTPKEIEIRLISMNDIDCICEFVGDQGEISMS